MLAPETQQDALCIIARLKDVDVAFRRTVRPHIRINPVKTGGTMRYHHYMSKSVRVQYLAYMRRSNVLLNRLLDLLPNDGVDHGEFYALCFNSEAWRQPYETILAENPPSTLAGLLFRRFAAMDNLWFVRSDTPAFARYAEIWRPYMDDPSTGLYTAPKSAVAATRETVYMDRIRTVMASVNTTMTEAEGFAAIRRIVGESLRSE